MAVVGFYIEAHEDSKKLLGYTTKTLARFTVLLAVLGVNKVSQKELIHKNCITTKRGSCQLDKRVRCEQVYMQFK